MRNSPITGQRPLAGDADGWDGIRLTNGADQARDRQTRRGIQGGCLSTTGSDSAAPDLVHRNKKLAAALLTNGRSEKRAAVDNVIIPRPQTSADCKSTSAPFST
jgi:hypothetical protein